MHKRAGCSRKAQEKPGAKTKRRAPPWAGGPDTQTAASGERPINAYRNFVVPAHFGFGFVRERGCGSK